MQVTHHHHRDRSLQQRSPESVLTLTAARCTPGSPVSVSATRPTLEEQDKGSNVTFNRLHTWITGISLCNTADKMGKRLPIGVAHLDHRYQSLQLLQGNEKRLLKGLHTWITGISLCNEIRQRDKPAMRRLHTWITGISLCN